MTELHKGQEWKDTNKKNDSKTIVGGGNGSTCGNLFNLDLTNGKLHLV